MTSLQRFWMTPLAVVCLLPSSTLQCQNSATSLAGTQSIGDMVMQRDVVPPDRPPKTIVNKDGVTVTRVSDAARRTRPISIFYMHGMNAAGANDSSLLRAGICKQLGECAINPLPRIYVDSGAFAVSSYPPKLTYMQNPIWKSPDDWNASAPFIDRYELSGNGHAPIMLYELNWWPLVYPLKCKWLIARDAALTGPAKKQISLCAPEAGKKEDLPDHPGRYLSYRWIDPQEAKDLDHISRHATFLNRSLKNGLMDWGFGDAVMTLGPMQEVITSGIRQMLVKSLESAGINLAAADAQDGQQFFFITHSLGSYLSLAALDSDWLGPQTVTLPEFAITPEERNAADYFSAHTAGFYFLANQVELLELARLSLPSGSSPTAPSTPSGTANPASIVHWQSMRQSFLNQHTNTAPTPQIIAWSDVNDLLSWDVPKINGVHVVNCHVRNPGFKLPPFLASPLSAHDNYAKNSQVLLVIFKPTPANADCSSQ